MEISGRRIKQARELRGLTQTELAVLAGVSQGLIGQAERGLRKPSEELMEKISEHTKFPVAFFSKDPVVEFPPELLLFRSHADMTQFEETEARRYAELIVEMVLALQRHISAIPIKLPKLKGSSPDEAAAAVRKAFHLPANEPVVNLVREVEKLGVLVLAIPAELRGRDAFSVWSEDHPIIALIKGPSGARLRLNVAHELGHLVLQHARITKAEEEREAFAFASSLLMPEEAIRREVRLPVTLSSLAALKPRWRVSVQALVRRVKDLGIITDRQYNYLNAQLSAKGWKKKEPGEFPAEKPRLLRQILEDVRAVSADRFASELNFDSNFVRMVVDGYAGRTDVSSPETLQTKGKVTPMRRSS
jgi:Zn-dependent peptidase ImmA (M78 family)/DNA-binding XRE family transcriptional regulator